MDNEIWESIKVGDTVILKLKNEQMIVGELTVLKRSSHVRLKNSRDYQTNQAFGMSIYYLNEVQDVLLFDATEIQNNVEEPVEDEQPEEDSFNKSFISDARSDTESNRVYEKSRVLLKDEKLAAINEMIKSCQYISQYDLKYFDAIKEMKEERQIGILLEKVQHGRMSEPTIFAVSTSKHVFIFDLLLLNGMNKELKEVLNNNSICKIIHHSRHTHDYVRNVCQVEIKFFFDTMTAYMYVTDTREVISINELLMNLFRLPLVSTEETDIDWFKRPLDSACMFEAATKVAYLIEVQQYLIHRKMLSAFYKASAKSMCQMSLEEQMPFRAVPYKGNEVVDIKFDKSSLDCSDFGEV